jgi:hypothetical protein
MIDTLYPYIPVHLKEYDSTYRYAVFINRAVDPDPIRIQGFDVQNLNKKYSKNLFSLFLSQIAIYLCPSYRRRLQPSKENIQHLKKGNLLTSFYVCR